MKVPALSEALASRAGLYRPARDVYHRLFRPDRRAARAQVLGFLGQFGSPGDLVFDVGAHEDGWTDSFVELGATVVAVEPMPAPARRIARRHGSSVSVENVALGSTVGQAELRIGRWTSLSSLAPRWIDVVDAGGVDWADRWTGERIVVGVTTLDELIDRYDVPDFVKIDVEGSEPEVLAGLSRPLRMLSFEALRDAPGLAHECIERLMDLGRYEFTSCPVSTGDSRWAPG